MWKMEGRKEGRGRGAGAGRGGAAGAGAGAGSKSRKVVSRTDNTLLDMRLRDIERLLSSEPSINVYVARLSMTPQEKKEIRHTIEELCSNPRRFFVRFADEGARISSDTFVQFLTALQLYPRLLTGEDLCELFEKLIGLRGCFYSMHMLDFEELKRALHIISETLQLNARCFVADTSFLTQTRATLSRVMDSKLLFHRYSGCCRSHEPRVREKPMKLRQDEFAMMMVDLRVVPESLNEEEVLEIFLRVWRERNGGAMAEESVKLLDFEGYVASIHEVAKLLGVDLGDDEEGGEKEGVKDEREGGREEARQGGRREARQEGKATGTGHSREREEEGRGGMMDEKDR